jgi:protein polybromo-1
MDTTTIRKSKRGRPITNKSSPSRVNRGRYRSHSIDEAEVKPNGEPLELAVYLEDFFDRICAHQDQNQRYISNLFYLLPSAKLYPDYYETIKTPIDLKQIAKKIISGNSYKTLREMESDLLLMCDNAKRYNEPKSIIYKDACMLKKLSRECCKDLIGYFNKRVYMQSAKTREKKVKLLQEISEMEEQEFNQLLAKSLTIPVTEPPKKEEICEAAVDEDEEEILADDASTRAENISKNPALAAMWSLFDYMKDYKHNNYNLMEPFTKLPSKRTYPDYYEEIKHPIALNIIKNKLNKRKYTSLKELVDDFKLMFNNAMQYNLEESLIYSNAKRLLDTLVHKSNELSLTIPKDAAVVPKSTATSTISANNNEAHAKISTPNKRTATSARSTLNQNKQAQQLQTTPTASSATTLPKFGDTKEKLIYLYNYINDYQIDGRELAYPFRHLPSKAEYPDYYSIIKKPIDMTKIWNKINHQATSMNAALSTTLSTGSASSGAGGALVYTSLDDMCAEFAQMYENACIYNEPNSTIYKDALTLQRALFLKREEIVEQERQQIVAPTCATIVSSLIATSSNNTAELANESNYFAHNETLPLDYISNSVHELLLCLFEACMTHQDLEGRVLSESFLDMYAMYDEQLSLIKNSEPEPFITFNIIRKRLNNRAYKRLDAFQDEMFQLFNQIRMKSYVNNTEGLSSFKIHRYSQLYKDAYDLQRYFIQKREELFRNGELLQSGALSYKLSSLDAHVVALINSIGGSAFSSISASMFDEMEALLVDERYRKLEKQLLDENDMNAESYDEETQKLTKLLPGNFYYMSKKHITSSLASECSFDNKNAQQSQSSTKNESLIVCLLALNSKQSKFIVQVYLRPIDDDFINARAKRVRKFFEQEVFKSDLYALVDLNKLDNIKDLELKPCYVVSIKEYMSSEVSLSPLPKENSEDDSENPPADQSPGKLKVNKEDLYACESIYSTRYRYFRKLVNKKWAPLSFVSNQLLQIHQPQQMLTFTKRVSPLLIEHFYMNETDVAKLVSEVDSRLDKYTCKQLFRPFHRESVTFDSAPSKLQDKDPEDGEHHIHTLHSEYEDPELMKTAKYYEQLVMPISSDKESECYKLGDYVYVARQANLNALTMCNSAELINKLPMIVRIDRLWSIKSEDGVNTYYLKGPLFLRPIEIMHELTRTFYRNEVFKETSMEVTAPLGHVVIGSTGSNSKKCVVMNTKKFISSRITEIDERDVYMCEAKYSLQTKTFRKFTKGLKKFELSIKCCEDEIYFMRHELLLRKHVSPQLLNMNIVYDDYEEDATESAGTGEKGNRDSGLHSKATEKPTKSENATAASGDGNNDYWSEIMREDDNEDEDDDDDDENSSHSFKQQNFASPGGLYNKKPTSITAQNNSGIIMQQSQSAGKKIRNKRAKKCGYNIFSKEFRKRLRDTRSSLSFVDMSKEVGNRWRALSDKERAAYEEKAKIESIKEAQRMAAEAAVAAAASQQTQQQVQHQQIQVATQLSSSSASLLSSPHSNHINQILAAQSASNQTIGGMANATAHAQYSTIVQAGNLMSTNTPQLANQAGSSVIVQQAIPNGVIAKQIPVLIYPNQINAQSTGSFIQVNQQSSPMSNVQQFVGQVSYDSNQLQNQQQQMQTIRVQETPKQVLHREAYIKYIANLRKQEQLHFSGTTVISHTKPGWYNNLDVEPSSVKESRVMPPPAAWIENCSSNDVLQHLLSLRYHMLNDAINIEKSLVLNEDTSNQID